MGLSELWWLDFRCRPARNLSVKFTSYCLDAVVITQPAGAVCLVLCDWFKPYVYLLVPPNPSLAWVPKTHSFLIFLINNHHFFSYQFLKTYVPHCPQYSLCARGGSLTKRPSVTQPGKPFSSELPAQEKEASSVTKIQIPPCLILFSGINVIKGPMSYIFTFYFSP